MNFSGRGNTNMRGYGNGYGAGDGWGRGYNYQQPGYGYGYAPYGYAPYGYGPQAPVAPVAPQAEVAGLTSLTADYRPLPGGHETRKYWCGFFSLVARHGIAADRNTGSQSNVRNCAIESITASGA